MFHELNRKFFSPSWNRINNTQSFGQTKCKINSKSFSRVRIERICVTCTSYCLKCTVFFSQKCFLRNLIFRLEMSLFDVTEMYFCFFFGMQTMFGIVYVHLTNFTILTHSPPPSPAFFACKKYLVVFYFFCFLETSDIEYQIDHIIFGVHE